MKGLSPRTRGSPTQIGGVRREIGPIPADAGEPAFRGAGRLRAGAYPRGRGGALRQGADGELGTGLSPRTRGSRSVPAVEQHVLGPIPADAGEPHSSLPVGGCRRAYPRGRGGAKQGRVIIDEAAGLSPRTRGSPQLPVRSAARGGPIPADAGEPCPSCPSCCPARAYPRGRGGACSPGQPTASTTGLSPRTRGSRRQAADCAHVVGPIPADAGEPRADAPDQDAPRAYPRGRGGADSGDHAVFGASGLSPRTRGSHAPHAHDQVSPGPIPADAGEPSSMTSSSSVTRAYPRGRGGAAAMAGGWINGVGLSPRTRGSPRGWAGADPGDGPIPADAGEPQVQSVLLEAKGAYPRGRGGAGKRRH